MDKRVLSAILSAYLAVLVAFSAELPAHAHHNGSTKCLYTSFRDACVSLPDNATVTWYPDGTLGNQVPGLGTAVAGAFADYDLFTDVTVTKSNPASLDVQVADANYAMEPRFGWVRCRDTTRTGPSGKKRCDRQKVRFNGSASVAFGFDTAHKRQYQACHEIGHTMGMREYEPADAYGDTCMFQWDLASPHGFPTQTNSDNDSHINSYV